LADKSYPNRTPVLTSYTSAQLARMPLVERRTYRKFNSLIRKYRIRVEHAIADLISMLAHFGDIQLSFVFFIPATSANVIHYIYFPILILVKEPVFSLLNVQC